VKPFLVDLRRDLRRKKRHMRRDVEWGDDLILSRAELGRAVQGEDEKRLRKSFG